ncbi:MAG TPA: hypothetical protein VGR78_00680 [Verrucomicrobiae bacterium]|nr:hypothetical protein [Verrucomicrobiae bacterium]
MTRSDLVLLTLVVLALLAALGGALRWGSSRSSNTEEKLKKDKTKTEFI